MKLIQYHQKIIIEKPMENNTTPPKEIWINQFEIDDVNKMSSSDLHLDPDGEVSFVEGMYNQEVKYLSEQSVNEMLAEKEREITMLKVLLDDAEQYEQYYKETYG